MAGTTKNAWILLAAVCALVMGIYAYVAQSGLLEMLSPSAADTYYNLLVRGFREGQLSLKKEVPPGLAQLADPYDPAANSPWRLMPYRLHDLVYYHDRLYLYHGVTPALILFWPFAAVTGHYLLHRQAVAIFCSIGFLASVGLLSATWRRYFPKVSVVVVAACALALGLATSAPELLSQADLYQVPISCGYMLTMLAMGAIWLALHDPAQRCRWLAVSSLMYGLAMGARPSLLVGAVVLLVPILAAWKTAKNTSGSPRPLGAVAFLRLFLCALGPITLIGLGLLLYNYQRFGNALEFGTHYQLSGDVYAPLKQPFSLGYLGFNLRLYFLQPVSWSGQFPFVGKITVPPLPPGHDNVENPFGILANVPIAWLALAVPLVWRGRSRAEASSLRWFVTSVVILFTISALTLGLYYFTCVRYEIEFLPMLLLLAVMGILGLEYALANHPGWRRAARWSWAVLLAFSVTFNLLACVEYHAAARTTLGIELFQAGKFSEAIQQYKEALHLSPDYAKAHFNLGLALERSGRITEAVKEYARALDLNPDYTKARRDQTPTLEQTVQLKETVEQYEQTLRLQPADAEAHYNLAVVLEKTGNIPDAILHYQQALRLKPDLIGAQTAVKRLQANQ